MTKSNELAPVVAPVARVTTDASMVVTACDTAFYEIFGGGSAGTKEALEGVAPGLDVIGRTFASLISPKDRRGLRAFTDGTTRHTGAFVDLTLELRFGVSHLCRVRARREGEAWNIFVEDLLRFEDDAFFALTQSAERWATVIGQSDDGIAILNEEHQIVQFNSKFLVLGAFTSAHGVALNEESLVERDLFELVTDEATFMAMRDRVELSRKKKRKRFRGVVERAERFVEVTTSAIHLPLTGFAGTCVIFKDVTAHHRLDVASRALGQKNADIQAMLNNLKQGIFTMVQGEVVHSEYSRHLEIILGVQSLTDKKVIPLLFDNSNIASDERGAIESTLRTTIGVDCLFFEINREVLPREIERTRPDGTSRVLQLDWVPLSNALDEVEKVLVTVRDVTDLRRLEMDQQRQGAELALIADLVNVTSKEFRDFQTESEGMLEQVRQQISPDRPDTSTTDAIFRHYHTIKGNSRFSGLRAVSSCAHDAETRLAALREDEALPWDQLQLLDDLTTLTDSINSYRRVNDEVLGRASFAPSASAGSLVLSADEVLKLIANVNAASSDPARTNDVVHSIQTSAAVGLRDVVDPIIDGLTLVAANLEKPVPSVQLKSDCLFGMDIALLKPMRNLLIHVLTNALDHGIDDPDTRAQRGVAPRGTISVQTDLLPDGSVQVCVSDDGPGFCLDLMRSRTQLPDAADADVAELIFRSGASTKKEVTMTSGRGVGMDAARQLAESFGGKLWVEFTDGQPGSIKSECRPIRFHIRVPPERVWSSQQAIEKAA